MNTIVTSKEAIITVCRVLAAENGLQSLNMRTVAKKCNVSVGSVYNYFPSKADLIVATIQDVWQHIFHMDKICKKVASFPDYVSWIFESVQSGVAEYPNFFTAHSISFASTEKGKARQVMEGYFIHMKTGLLKALQSDAKVTPSAFSKNFTESDFVDFVFSNLLSLLMKQESSCAMLTEIIKRTIY
ncbi:TetR/AcrR family transcriptional regulator [Sedimentibacter sp. zth1]|nr:TetR/AcrR family transcriptional regulator [Sedimentibacter sp. zth1]